MRHTGPGSPHRWTHAATAASSRARSAGPPDEAVFQPPARRRVPRVPVQGRHAGRVSDPQRIDLACQGGQPSGGGV